MRLHAIVEESIVDGPGLRFVVFLQGCRHGCPGCHNPQTHDPSGGYETTGEELLTLFADAAMGNPLLAGVTITGGEPMLQAAELLPFVRKIRALGFGVWLYSGYTLEELAERWEPDELALLEAVDTLVDGRYVEELRTLDRRFVGSENQRIIERPGKLAREMREGL